MVHDAVNTVAPGIQADQTHQIASAVVEPARQNTRQNTRYNKMEPAMGVPTMGMPMVAANEGPLTPFDLPL